MNDKTTALTELNHAQDMLKSRSGNARLQVYLVGGAVRDMLLNKPTQDWDFMVVGATPQDMLAAGFRQVGKDFPVFLHPDTQHEYALARTERKAGRGYHGFELVFNPSISLEEDLRRRDLTINAMAMNADGALIDPYDGSKDIQQKKLTHVSPAFSEDPLRVLRTARFAARFASLGFTVSQKTQALMTQISQSGELTVLAAERVWTETERALTEHDAQVYFQVLRDCGALAHWFAEVDALFGVPQRADYHPEIDTGLHTLLSIKQACLAKAPTIVRFAVLTHDLGKALTPESVLPRHTGHEERGIAPVQQLCERLKVPRAYKKFATLVCRYHLLCHKIFELTPKRIVKLIDQLDGIRAPSQVHHFALACTYDAKGRTGLEHKPYPQAAFLLVCLDAARAVNINSLPEAQRQRLIAAGAGVKIAEAIHRCRVNAVTQVKASTSIDHQQRTKCYTNHDINS